MFDEHVSENTKLAMVKNCTHLIFLSTRHAARHQWTGSSSTNSLMEPYISNF